jgi:hypothetical protein
MSSNDTARDTYKLTLLNHINNVSISIFNNIATIINNKYKIENNEFVSIFTNILNTNILPKKQPAKKQAKKTVKKEDYKAKVIENLNKNIIKLQLRRNKYGNYEHPETHFVFDRDSGEIIGKQKDTNIIELTAEDIDTCKLNNFKYKMPIVLRRENE